MSARTRASKAWNCRTEVLRGKKAKKRPRPCPKCGGRYCHRKSTCLGTLECPD